MRAHILAEDGTITNTAEVRGLDSMPGLTLVDAAIGGQIGDKIVNGVVIAQVRVSTREQLKSDRAAAVASIIVQVGDKTFDGDEGSQSRMARAILIAQATGLQQTTWTLADNRIVQVTLPELTQALALAGQRQAELWPIPEA